MIKIQNKNCPRMTRITTNFRRGEPMCSPAYYSPLIFHQSPKSSVYSVYSVGSFKLEEI